MRTAKGIETSSGPLADCESLTEIDYSMFATNLDTLYKYELDTCFISKHVFNFEGVFDEINRPRPLAFDQNKHKVLNTELKQLYTAITRARVHVWIFDENEDNRAPMFEYFKARKLVQSVKEGETGGMCQYAAKL